MRDRDGRVVAVTGAFGNLGAAVAQLADAGAAKAAIDAPQNRKDMPDADATRRVTPQQVAEVIGFLLSDAAAALTGALIPVAGRL